MAEMFIGGEAIALPERERRTISNPASGQPVDTVPAGTAEDVDRAVQIANNAFIGWWETSAARRGEIVHHGARHVLSHIGDLARLLTDEQGKPLRESQAGDPPFRAHARALRGPGQEHPRRLRPEPRQGHLRARDQAPARRGRRDRAVELPDDAARQQAGARAGGGQHDGGQAGRLRRRSTTLRIAALLHEAGCPRACSTSSPGRARSVGEALVKHPLVRKIGFTGSTPVGERVMALAAKGAKRLTLELGGSDPMIVLADADVAGAASAASVGRFFNCGQACLAVKRVFVAEEVADDFVERLVTQGARSSTIGPGTMEGVFLGPLHSERQRAEIEEQVADAAQRRRDPDRRRRPRGRALRAGLLLRADDRARAGARRARRDRGGLRAGAADLERSAGSPRAIERANDSPFGLGSSVWTHDLDAASWAAERIQAGYTWINSPQRVFDELPFGGWGASGFGKEHGSEALEHYMEAEVRRRAPLEAGMNNSGTLVDRRLEAGHGDKVAIRCAGERAHLRAAARPDLPRGQRARGARRRPRGPRADGPRRLADVPGAVPRRDAHRRRARAGVLPRHDRELRATTRATPTRS